MVRFIKWVIIFIIILMIICLISLWLSLPYWITPVTQRFLPPNISILIKEKPQFIKNGIKTADVQINIGQCQFAQLENVAVIYQNGRFIANGDQLNVDSKCLAYLDSTENGDTEPLSLEKIQQQLPLFDLKINHVTIDPWQQYSGQIEINNNGQIQNILYHSDLINAEASLNSQQELTVKSFSLLLPEANEKLELEGMITVPITLDKIPVAGEVKGQFSSNVFDKPLLLDLSWNNHSGNLNIKEQDADNDLVNLPWTLAENRFVIEQGQWIWPYSEMPLSGGVSLSLTNWENDYSKAQFKGRINLLTSGHGGKANLVMTLGPDPISLLDNNIRFQLTGKASLENIAAYITIPGAITDNLLDPTIKFAPGSLLRATGKVGTDITLHEARFPLAGVWLTTQGINGPLQAIVNASHRQWGTYKLHLDGKAEHFWPDNGLWQWKFWGDGNIPLFKAKWDAAGRGRWQDHLVTIEEMSTGLNELSYGQVKVHAPRFTLTTPLIWQRNQQNFAADLQLQANRITFPNGGYLPKTVLGLTLKGTDPNSFVWNGQLAANPVGPIRLNGRWDGERLRGEAWWPKQSLQVFQSLLPADTDIKIRSGILYAQAAFSAAQKQGFQAGGHFVVSNGRLWLKDGEVNGVDFTASYLFKDHVWQLGTKGPIKLKIAQLKNLFDMRNITANLQGYYPYSNKRPLVLSHVAVDMLGGHISMTDFRLPIIGSTTLRVENIELSELFTVLKPKQVAMSGRISGELPLYIDNPNWLVKNGWVENMGYLTLRLDQQFVDAIVKDDAVTGAAMDWLRYVEISRLRADINVSNLGILTMDVQIKGVNSAKDKEKPVVLNYAHEENIFQLWRSLRFGDNLQDWVEQQLTHPRGDKK